MREGGRKKGREDEEGEGGRRGEEERRGKEGEGRERVLPNQAK